MSDRRWLALDGLRGVAVLMVVVDHMGLTPGRPAGSGGVAVFFVLSGFLITQVIIGARRRGAWSMAGFMMARAVRLVPALVVLDLVVLVWWVLDGRALSDVLGQVVAATLFVSNIGVGPNEVMRHTWSLSTEEQFYLLWPLVLPLVLKARSPARVLVIAILASVCARLGLAVMGLGAWSYASLVANAFAMLLGGLVAVGGFALAPGRIQRATPVACLLAIFVVVWAVPNPGGMFLAPIAIAPLAAVAVAVALNGAALLESPALRFVGRISYALYLWHWPVLRLTGEFDAGASAVLPIIVSFALATASTLLIEEPVRRRWRARNRPRSIVSATARTRPT